MSGVKGVLTRRGEGSFCFAQRLPCTSGCGRTTLLEAQQATDSQLRAILEAHHPALARLFSSVDRPITLHFFLGYPAPAAASPIKTARMNGFLSRHRYTSRVPGQVLAERLARTCSLPRPAASPVPSGRRRGIGDR